MGQPKKGDVVYLLEDEAPYTTRDAFTVINVLDLKQLNKIFITAEPRDTEGKKLSKESIAWRLVDEPIVKIPQEKSYSELVLDAPEEEIPKRGRGRPRKTPLVAAAVEAVAAQFEQEIALAVPWDQYVQDETATLAVVFADYAPRDALTALFYAELEGHDSPYEDEGIFELMDEVRVERGKRWSPAQVADMFKVLCEWIEVDPPQELMEMLKRPQPKERKAGGLTVHRQIPPGPPPGVAAAEKKMIEADEKALAEPRIKPAVPEKSNGNPITTDSATMILTGMALMLAGMTNNDPMVLVNDAMRRIAQV